MLRESLGGRENFKFLEIFLNFFSTRYSGSCHKAVDIWYLDGEMPDFMGFSVEKRV